MTYRVAPKCGSAGMEGIKEITFVPSSYDYSLYAQILLLPRLEVLY